MLYGVFKVSRIGKRRMQRGDKREERREKEKKEMGEGGDRDKCLSIDSCPPFSETDIKLKSRNQTNPSKINVGAPAGTQAGIVRHMD